MLHVNKLIIQGRGLAPALLKRAPTLTLPWSQRRLAHLEASDSQGRTLTIALPAGTVMRGGDVLVAEDGSLLRVHAAEQRLLEVRPCTEHGTPADLLRAAYHLGSRHVAVQAKNECLWIEPDADSRRMLERMHLIVAETVACFEPEGEAGAHDHAHGHRHGHDHGHHHGHHEHHDHGQAHGDHGHDHHDHQHGHGQHKHEH